MNDRLRVAVRPPTQVLRVRPGDDWERIGKPHFLSKRAFQSAQPPSINSILRRIHGLWRRG